MATHEITLVSRFWIGFWWLLAVALALYSCAINGYYGHEIWGGTDALWQKAYAAGLVALDLTKFALAAYVPLAWAQQRRLTAAGMVIVVISLSCLSIWANFTVGQRGNFIANAEQQGAKAAKTQRLDELKAQKGRLVAEYKLIAGLGDAEALKRQMKAMHYDRRWDSTLGCTDATATRSRKFCAKHGELFAKVAAATRAEQLRPQIDRLSAEIRSLTTSETLTRAVDPFSELSAILGVSEGWLRTFSSLALVILIELGGVITWAIASDTSLHARKRSPAASSEVVGSVKPEAILAVEQ